MNGKNSKRGQAWSLELIIIVIVFFTALAIFGALALKKEPKTKDLISDAEKTMQFVSADSPISFVLEGTINETKATEFNYTQLKRSIGIKSYICIYFEDKYGNLMKINNTMQGLGDQNITINDQPCIPE